MTKYEIYKLTKTYTIYKDLTRAFIAPLGKMWAVFAKSSKYNRVVNTHLFTNKKEAALTRNEINETGSKATR